MDVQGLGGATEQQTTRQARQQATNPARPSKHSPPRPTQVAAITSGAARKDVPHTPNAGPALNGWPSPAGLRVARWMR